MSTSTEIIEEIHVDDVGTVLEVTLKNDNTPVDISSATTKQIILQNPSLTGGAFAAAFTTDGTDGRLQYTTTVNDLDESGVWQIQAYVVTPEGAWHSDIKEFSVFPNLSS